MLSDPILAISRQSLARLLNCLFRKTCSSEPIERLVFGIFAFLSTRFGAPTRRRTALVWSLVAVIVLMGPSRLVKLAHWPADVLFSYLMGGALILGAIWLHQRLLPWLEPRIPRLHSILTADGRYRRWLTK